METTIYGRSTTGSVTTTTTTTSSSSSPPGLTASKSSKSSSFHSLSSDNDHTVLSDVSHFEDIGLDDTLVADSYLHLADPHHLHKPSHNPYGAPPSTFAPPTARSSSLKAPHGPLASSERVRDAVPRSRSLRGTAAPPKSRPPLLTLKTQVGHGRPPSRSSSLGLHPDPYASPLPLRPPSHRSSSSSSASLHRHRSTSPSFLTPRDPNVRSAPRRRSSWQSDRERKSALERELECDDEDDDDDDIPDGLVLDNVPISPRPPHERAQSRQPSPSPSPEPSPEPERTRKDGKVRRVGNGTPPVAAAQGSLRSPSWRSDSAVGIGIATAPATANAIAPSPTSSVATSPVKARAKSWTAALAELSDEAKELTQKLEEHADEMHQQHQQQPQRQPQHKSQRSSTGSLPDIRRVGSYADGLPHQYGGGVKPRVRSALPELPPLRRTNIMIDPLPVSKEKEAVLSRTRPSWLPPKDPAEERRHLKQYQKMVAQSLEAERRREATRRARSECRDVAVDGLMRIWEDDVLPRFDDAVRERRTRELWWRGVAPRSRGRVWPRAIGNELGLTEASYRAALGRARDAEARAAAGTAGVEDARCAAWFAAIRRDAEERTWRDLRIFQADGPLHQGLVDVLSAYAMYRSDIGYVTGCNAIAALLLLNLPDPASTFIALANVLNRPLPLSFYAADPGAKASAYNLLMQTLARKSQGLHDHLSRLADHDPDRYLGGVFTSLFTDCLALDEASRLWDIYVFEGDAVLVRAGVALLLREEMSLLGAKSVSEVQAVLAAGSSASPEAGKRPVVAGDGDDDRWIRAVRDAGKG